MSGCPKTECDCECAASEDTGALVTTATLPVTPTVVREVEELLSSESDC